jgi:hypothetical protein
MAFIGRKVVAGGEWPRWRFEAAAARSVAIHGNRAVLPTAAWIYECDVNAVSAPEVYRGLRGELAPNKALDALQRLAQIGALEELPHLGRPYPRTFQRLESPYWGLVQQELQALQGASR